MDGRGKKPEGKSHRRRPSPAPEKNPTQVTNANSAFVVGVGGSAGGLDAFERLFAAMPRDTGMAFVVIQHLDPTHKALMPELLQRATALKVVEITDGMEIEPNRVFVLPPGQYVTIHDGRLWLSPAITPHGARTPVDAFFTSLAADRKEKSIGIIVSGMGMDGTLGIKAIKEQLGAVLVQDPVTAKYDSMPSSAIATGIADYVAQVDDMPAILVKYVAHASRPQEEPEAQTDKAQSSLQRILALLYAATGHDFSLYKKGTLYRRIERRASIHHLDGIADYARYLEENPTEADALFKDFFIGVTSFFRDLAAYELLQNKVFPQLLEGKTQDDTVRIWVAGCSTGEEVYSIIMALQESLDKMPGGLNITIQAFATDIDAAAIHTARRAVYSESAVAGVSPERLERFFVRLDDGYQVKKSIREAVVFAPHNIISAPPFTKLDMISCRNLLIYFDAELQKKLIPVFHYALNPDGILFLGSSETISGYDNLFSAIDSKWKLFKRKDYPAVWTGMVDLRGAPTALKHPEPSAAVNVVRGSVPDIAQRVLLEQYAPAAVVIDESGDILYVSGRTGKYLELPAGKTTWNLCAMARDGLRYELAAAVRKATAENAEVIVKGVNVITDVGSQLVDLNVRPFSKPEGLGGLLLVVFEDSISPMQNPTSQLTAGEAGVSCPHCPELEQELRRTKQYLHTTIEEMQSTQEEMLSANEEFQSTNEELQSTNEELMTSKEEMQSLNEELTTVNTEFQMKNEELTVVNNDMVNLLNSTQIATVFLDTDLNIRRFTPSVSGIVNLRQSDIGRPLAEIAPNLTYDALVSDAKHVLDTLVGREAQVMTKDGLWFTMRIIPYRTLDNVIDGVVVTFTDITVPKRLEESLRESEQRFHTLFESMNEGFALCEIILDDSGKPCDWRYLDVNPAFGPNTGLDVGDVVGKKVSEILPNIEPHWIESYGQVALTGQPARIENYAQDLDRDFEVHAFSPAKGQFAVVFVDVTERKDAERALQKYQMLSENSRDIILFIHPDGRVFEANEAAVSAYGYTRDELLALSVFDLRLPESIAQTQEQLAMADTQGIRFEALHRRKDGSIFPVEVSSRGTDIGDQRFLLSIIRDITERKRAEQLNSALNDINSAMRSTLDFHEVMESVLTESIAAMGVESGSITMREDGHWIVRHIQAFPKLALGTRFSDEDLPHALRAVREKMPIATNDTHRSGGSEHETAREYGIRAFMAIPLVVGDETLGVLWLNNHSCPFTFGDTEIDFATKLGASVSLALENVRLYEAEHDARSREESIRAKLQAQHGEMQQALLPGKMQVFDGWEIATRFVSGTAGEQIGGDFYDVFETEDSKIGILIGDVAGKGIEAGALAAVTRSTVRAFAFELSSPGLALSHTNSGVCRQGFTNDRFATVFLAILDPKTGKLSYSSAGHPPAMILRSDGRVELLTAGSLPIRVAESVNYRTEEADLAPGDKLVIYTDGISEARDNTRIYDIDGIEKTLRHQPNSSPEDTIDMLFRVAGDICKGPLFDDAAVIVVERQRP